MLGRILLSCVLVFASIEKIQGCTGIVHRAESGDWVYARTMEFGDNLLTFDLLFVPRGFNQTAMTTNGSPGFKWVTKYAFVGFNPFGLPIVGDGINEKGVACGCFYLPGWAEYEKAAPGSASVISNLDFVSWVLGNFATVEEVRKALKQTKVVGVTYKSWGIVPPLHYMIADRKGDRAIVEYTGGTLKLYDGTLGVITNAPTYDWHVSNARNYIGLRALNEPSVMINDKELSQFGQGSGALGLPGDFTPPSRFIRAAFLNQVVLSGSDALSEILRAFKILNQFDIPKGAVKEIADGESRYDVTLWTSAADLSGKRYFFHTARNRAIQVVDLMKLELNGKNMKSISIDQPEAIANITDKLE